MNPQISIDVPTSLVGMVNVSIYSEHTLGNVSGLHFLEIVATLQNHM